MTRLALLLLPLLLTGCPEPEPDPEPEDPQQVEAEAIDWDRVRPAIDAMLERISVLNAQGWPSRVGLAANRKPNLEIAPILDRTRERADVVGLRNELLNAVVKQDVVNVVDETEEELPSVNAERDYAGEGGAAKSSEPPGLILEGVLEPVEGGVRLDLRLLDRRRAVLAATDATTSR